MLQNIPQELRALPHWCAANQQKIPIDPKTGKAASVTDARTWGTFEQACAMGAPHIGFVLSPHDPFCVIDLDVKMDKPATDEERRLHAEIVERFDTYTEKSAGGLGLHVVLKGSLIRGRRRGSVEVYSQDRFIICTGNVVRNVAIAERQPLLESLLKQMPESQNAPLPDERPELVCDGELYRMGLAAANGDKFAALMHGKWREFGYPSQSEADYALMAMLAYYTPNNAQVLRVFRLSELGRRAKAQRDDYLNDMLRKMRAKELPPIDISSLKIPTVTQQTPTQEFAEVQGVAPARGYRLPPGLVGEMASYIYSSSKFPTQEVSLSAAIALAAGIAGRAYNISGTGLNQYMLILAPTGTGKEEAAKGIARLLQTARNQMPIITDFRGPGAFASGQAIIRTLDERPSYVSVLGEFGDRLHMMNNPRASGAEKLIRTVMLDLYNKSGFDQVLDSTAYSDTQKNTKTIRAPALTILGEGAPEKFYANIGPQDIQDGFLPRFLFLEFEGKRSYGNETHGFLPPPSLVTKLVNMATTAVTVQHNNTVCQVAQDAAGAEILKRFDHMCTDRVNDGEAGTRELWSRAHLKAIRLAALIAVGCDWHNPIINADIAEWSVQFVRRSTEHLISKFIGGFVGYGDDKCEAEVRSILRDYYTLHPRQRKTYRVRDDVWQRGLFARNYVWNRVARLSCFYNDRRGASRALDDTIGNMVKNGVLIEIPAVQTAKEFGLRTPLFGPGENW